MSLSADVNHDLAMALPSIRVHRTRTGMLHFTLGNFTVDELRSHLRQFEELLVSARTGVLYDVRDAKLINVAERQLYVEFIQTRGDFLQRQCAALAIVLDSPVKRGILTAVQWAVTFPFPMRVFSQTEDAERWLSTQV